ncbi:hypothetical protein [Clostridium perfringens]|uniref:hypothetical protein n=1 Tax=Clostridium perfringens TaxID=1502 RepID=UPI0023402B98|nr:hypothetical protein [Clostridium perfringens]MDC4245514.1 hypothetical protein [Clostridium perfringens]
MLKDYFGQPDYIEGIGEIYPIKVLEYQEFQQLAQRYITIDKKALEIELGEEFKESTLMLVLSQIKAYEIANDDNRLALVGSNELEQFKVLREAEYKLNIEDFEKVLKMILHKDVFYDEDGVRFKIQDEDILSEKEINQENFDEFKKVVMRQNLLFTPLYYEDPILQSILMSLRENKAQESNSQFDLETICQVVSNEKKIPQYELQNFTYYMLIADYTRLSVIDNHDLGKQVKSSGFASEGFEIPKRDEVVNLYKHPEDTMIEFNSAVFDKGDKL